MGNNSNQKCILILILSREWLKLRRNIKSLVGKGN